MILVWKVVGYVGDVGNSGGDSMDGMGIILYAHYTRHSSIERSMRFTAVQYQ